MRLEAAPTTAAIREAAEYIVGKFGKGAAGETVEQVTGNAAKLVAKHGDEALVFLRRSGHAGYVANGLTELLAQRGADGADLAGLAARLIGRQLQRRAREILGVGADGLGAAGFGAFLEAMATGEGTHATTTSDGPQVVVTWPAPRLLRAAEGDAGAIFAVWSGLWEGCLSTHDRLLTLDATRTADVVRLRIAPR
jgi:hypothetical protein